MIKHIYIASCKCDGGIYHYVFEDGKLNFIDKVNLDRPMYMLIRNNKMYVLLREIDTDTHFGGLISYDIDKDGKLINPSGIMSTNGIVPCHLDVTEDGIYIVNYLSGNIVKMPDKIVTHKGMGVHKTRQDAPHTHFTMRTPDKKYILCTDLGTDEIFIYDEQLNEQFAVKVPSGSGARHLCFSEDNEYLYCVNELSNNVSVFKYNEGKLKLKGTYDAIPEFKGQSIAAAIRIKDGYLYVSNRGADTISRFKVSGEKIELLENTYCGGASPRDFDIIDGYIFCANESTNNVTVMLLENGKPVLTETSININNPICITGG